MDFSAPRPVSELTEIIRAELAERLGVRMASMLVHARVNATAVLATEVFVIARFVREGGACGDACAVPLIRNADRLARNLWCIANDGRMADSLAYDIAMMGFRLVQEIYPLVALREVGA